jgi:hypothetical protein
MTSLIFEVVKRSVFERAEVREPVCAILSAENAGNEYFHYQSKNDVFGDISNPGLI